MKNLPFLFAVIVVCFCLKIKAQEQNQQYTNISTINYCQAVKESKNYNGKTIKIFAEYMAGFEHSWLGSQSCANDYGQIWVEWENYRSCGDEKTTQLLANREKGIENSYLEGIFVGKFFVKQAETGFGHMNASPFKLVVSCVESARLLPEENSGCERIDKTSPFHYLEYVKTELDIPPRYINKTKKKEQLVWVRLVNNSSCSITVPMVANKSNELQGNKKAMIVYKLDGREITGDSIITRTKFKSHFITDEKRILSILPSGNSMYFVVPLRYFKKDWNISVPFQYADRKAKEGYDPFYFARTDLPREIFKK